MGDFMHGARNPIKERDDRIAMLEARLAAYDRLWADACAALSLAGIPDWAPEDGRDPKEGRNRILPVSERVGRLVVQRDRLSRIAHDVHLTLRHAREYITQVSALDPPGASSVTLLCDIDRALRGDA